MRSFYEFSELLSQGLLLLMILTNVAQVQCSVTVAVRHPDQLTIPECYSNSEHCSSYQDCCEGDRKVQPSTMGITCEGAFLCTNGTCDSLKGQYSVYMVTRCPAGSGTNSEWHSRCHSALEQVHSDRMALPVYSNRSGLLYRSVYCALCHGETVTTPTAQVVLFCNGSATSNCKSVAIVEAHETHVCYSNLADATVCEGSYPSLTESCDRAPTRYEVCEGIAYRNVYCRMCQLGWYAPQCQHTDYPLWQLRNSLDHGLLGVYVGFRNLNLNLPGRDFSRWNNGTSSGSWQLAVSLYVTHAASITALLALIAIYLCVPSLRNRQGLCLCCHAVCVMVWEALAIATQALQPTQTRCLSLLLLSYFCLTSAFSWAAVFGGDLFRSLASNLPARGLSKWLMLIVWLPPVALTACAGFLHAWLGLFDLAACQFAPCHKWLMLALSLTPLGMTLIINLAVSAAVCVILRRRARSAQQMESTIGAARARRLAGAAVRVSAAAGVAWLPQFILANLPDSVAVDHRAASVIGEHLAALHGVLLALCFGCGSRRVRQLVLKPTRQQQARAV